MLSHPQGGFGFRLRAMGGYALPIVWVVGAATVTVLSTVLFLQGYAWVDWLVVPGLVLTMMGGSALTRRLQWGAGRDPVVVHHDYLEIPGWGPFRRRHRWHDLLALDFVGNALLLDFGPRRVLLPLQGLARPDDAPRLRDAVVAAVAATPGGDERLRAFMTESRRANALRALPTRATRGLILLNLALCAALILAQEQDPLALIDFGANVSTLVKAGEVWRLLMAGMLHNNLVHLGFNMFALLVVGGYAERLVGVWRFLIVYVATGVVGAAASAFMRGGESLGASASILGVLGLLLGLQLVAGRAIPARFKLPRSTWLALAAVNVPMSLLWFVDGWAHLGGFVSGVVFGALMMWPARTAIPPAQSMAVKIAGVVAAALAAAALATAANNLARPHDDRLHDTTEALVHSTSAPELNGLAWMLVVSDGRAGPTERMASSTELLAAERLASRAVELSKRAEPGFLDTLAEVAYRRGDADRALALGREALAAARRQGNGSGPGVAYYERQVLRFRSQSGPLPQQP